MFFSEDAFKLASFVCLLQSRRLDEPRETADKLCSYLLSQFMQLKLEAEELRSSLPKGQTFSNFFEENVCRREATSAPLCPLSRSSAYAFIVKRRRGKFISELSTSYRRVDLDFIKI